MILGSLISLVRPSRSRPLIVQSLVDTFFSGLFLAGSPVLLTRWAGLDVREVGLAMTVAGIVSLAAAGLLGRVVDRFSSLSVWVVGSVLEAACIACYALISGVALAMVVLSLSAFAVCVATAGRQHYTFLSLAGENRVLELARIRTALNIGFGAAGLAVAGLFALPAGNIVYWAVLALATAGKLLSIVFIMRLPEGSVATGEDAEEEHEGTAEGHVRSPWRHPRLAAMSLLVGVGMTDEIVLATTAPTWILASTSAPAWLLGVLFTMNTAVVILLQIPLSRGAETQGSAARAFSQGAVSAALGCIALLALPVLDSRASMVLVAALLVVVYLLLSVSEVRMSASDWGLQSAHFPDTRLGEYQAAWRLGSELPSAAAPLVFGIVLSVSSIGWGLIAAMFIACAVLLRIVTPKEGAPPLHATDGVRT